MIPEDSSLVQLTPCLFLKQLGDKTQTSFSAPASISQQSTEPAREWAGLVQLGEGEILKGDRPVLCPGRAELGQTHTLCVLHEKQHSNNPQWQGIIYQEQDPEETPKQKGGVEPSDL